MTTPVRGEEIASSVYFQDSPLGTLPKELLELILQWIPKEKRFRAIVNFGLATQAIYNLVFLSKWRISQSIVFCKHLHRATKMQTLKVHFTTLSCPSLQLGSLKWVGVLPSGEAVYYARSSSHIVVWDSICGEGTVCKIKSAGRMHIRGLLPFGQGSFILIEQRGIFVFQGKTQKLAYHRLINTQDREYKIASGILLDKRVFLLISRQKGRRGNKAFIFNPLFNLETSSYIKTALDALDTFQQIRGVYRQIGRQGSSSQLALNFIKGSNLFFLPGCDIDHIVREPDMDEDLSVSPLDTVKVDDKLHAYFAAESHKASLYSNAYRLSIRNGKQQLEAHLAAVEAEREWAGLDVGKRVYQLQSDGSKTLFATVPCVRRYADSGNFLFFKNGEGLVSLYLGSKGKSGLHIYAFDSAGDLMSEKKWASPSPTSKSRFCFKEDCLVIGDLTASKLSLFVLHIPTGKVLVDEHKPIEVLSAELNAIELIHKDGGRFQVFLFLHQKNNPTCAFARKVEFSFS